MMGNGKILLVEDEASLQRLLKYDLEQSGFEVTAVDNGADAYEIAKQGTFEFILLDWMLPQMTGIEVCRKLRELGNTSYIMMLTAKSEELDMIEGLSEGADDYIRKPFSTREVVARIKAVMRRKSMAAEKKETQQVRGTATTEEKLHYRNINIDTQRYEVYMDGQKVEMTLTEFELLMYMVKNQGKVLSRDHLLGSVWGYEYDGDTRTVDVYIFKLREKLEADASKRLFKTIRGVGYMLEKE
ncbi:MAG: response regulator transcription factor [Culicoidibacterales bacterium]